MWPFSTPVFKSELFFSKGFYYYLMVSNLLLRLAWTYKLSPHLRRNHDTVLAFTLLEVCGALSPPLPQPLQFLGQVLGLLAVLSESRG